MSATPFAEHAAIAHAMKGIDFPARRRQLLETARANRADDAVIKDIERLPETHLYKNVAEVLHALGHHATPTP